MWVGLKNIHAISCMTKTQTIIPSVQIVSPKIQEEFDNIAKDW